ncbi:acyl-CoA dehydrogenase family protein [Chloroflexota bacterium]
MPPGWDCPTLNKGAKMDLALSEEQEMLRKMARDFLADRCPKTLVREMEEDEKGYSPELWREMAGLGLLGLAFPEKYGGSGGSFLDLAVLLEEMGRALLPGPFFSAVVLGGLTILDAGSEAQKQEFLPQISRGETIMALALTEPSAGYDAASVSLRAAADKDDYILDGTKLFVSDAHICHYMICVARTGEGGSPEEGITLFLVDAKSPGISYTLLDTIASDRQCEVVFDKVRVPQTNILGGLDQGWSVMKRVLERAAAGKSMEMVGNSQQVLEMSVNYAKEREQFGQPIGSFQAIQHYFAHMATDVDGSRFIAYQAAWMLSEGLPCASEVSTAKAWVSEACRRVDLTGHQIHGGIGFTKDHDIQLYFRRAKAAELAFGDARFHREVVANQGLGL